MSKKINLTVPSFTFDKTSDKNLQRFVDRSGNWTHYWLVKEKRFVPAVNHILGLGFNKGPRFQEYLLSVTKEEAKEILEIAGEEGTRTHKAIRDLLDGLKVTMDTKYPNELAGGRQEALNDDEWDNLVAFRDWCEKYQPELISNDFAVYSIKAHDMEFAGSPDALLVITVPSGDKVFPKAVWGKKVLFLPDWKSSSAIHLEYKVQLAAYFHAIKERNKFGKFFKEYSDRIFTGIVRLGTKHKAGYEMEIWNESETESNFWLFISAYNIFRQHRPDFKPEVEQIPTQLLIKVPKAKIVKPKKTPLIKK